MKKSLPYIFLILFLVSINSFAETPFKSPSQVKQVDRPEVTSKKVNMSLPVSIISGFGKDGANNMEKVLKSDIRNCVCIPTAIHAEDLDVIPLACMCQKHGTKEIELKDQQKMTEKKK
jgi:hypothetical protein